jgi:hypothetical protein
MPSDRTGAYCTSVIPNPAPCITPSVAIEYLRKDMRMAKNLPGEWFSGGMVGMHAHYNRSRLIGR